MSIQKENSDIVSMNKIENISKKISDLINEKLSKILISKKILFGTHNSGL